VYICNLCFKSSKCCTVRKRKQTSPVLSFVLEVCCPNAIVPEGIQRKVCRDKPEPLTPSYYSVHSSLPGSRQLAVLTMRGKRKRMAEGSRAQPYIAESLHILLPNKASTQKDNEDAIGPYQIHASEQRGALQQCIQATDRDLPSKCRPCSLSILPTTKQQDSTL